MLEDFKQFLPESAAQARAAAAAKAAADEAAGLAVGPAGSHASSMGISNSRLPAVGTFAPPPAVGKEAKKKRGTAALASIQADIKSDSVLGVVRGVNKVRVAIILCRVYATRIYHTKFDASQNLN